VVVVGAAVRAAFLYALQVANKQTMKTTQKIQQTVKDPKAVEYEQLPSVLKEIVHPR